MMIDDKTVLEIMERYEIPITVDNMKTVKKIGECSHFDSVDKWDKLVKYLKERAERNLLNKDQESAPSEYLSIQPDWLFYLKEYKTYIKILRRISWNINENYLFPNDIIDIVYKYSNEKNLIFLKFMEEHTDSLGFEIEEKCYGELK